MKFRFNPKYAIYSASLLAVAGILIFLISDDEFNRNVGNVIFVLLAYCLVQTFFEADKKNCLYAVGSLALIFEFSKTAGWIDSTGLADNLIIRGLTGSEFSFDHILSYTAGCAMIWLLEFYKDEGRPRKKKFLGF